MAYHDRKLNVIVWKQFLIRISWKVSMFMIYGLVYLVNHCVVSSPTAIFFNFFFISMVYAYMYDDKHLVV